MPVDPAAVIAEVLGEPAAEMRNPANADYRCPFIDAECTKRSQALHGPYPVCSVFKPSGRGANRHTKYVCLCPKRFFEIDILGEVVSRCWPGTPPTNPQYVHEIKMSHFGNVDFVVADVAANGSVSQFVSVELQAVDCTGSVFDAYDALTRNAMLDEMPEFGLNLANVFKRYVTQLIGKGYFHHHWGTKIVSVVQDVVFEDIKKRTNFPSINLDQANIVFMAYSFDKDPATGRYVPKLSSVVGTHHSNLQNAILYRTPPSKRDFCARIEAQLRKGELHVGVPEEINLAEEQCTDVGDEFGPPLTTDSSN